MTQRPLIAISVAGSPDAQRLGFDEIHLRDLSIEIAHVFLSLGCNLAYGGDLRTTGFTQELLGVVARETQDLWKVEPADDPNVPQPEPRDPRLFSYLAWPFTTTLTTEQEALLLHTCRLRRVLPEEAGWKKETFDAKNAMDKQAQTHREARVTATCLSRMREIMSRGEQSQSQSLPAASMRIVVGGASETMYGFWPGVVEEGAMALRDHCPTIVLGGFGGGAGLLAQALFGGSFPRGLERDYLKDFVPYRNLHEKDPEHRDSDPVRGPAKPVDELRQILIQASTLSKSELCTFLGNGLDYDENRALANLDGQGLGPGDNRSTLALLRKSALAVLQFPQGR